MTNVASTIWSLCYDSTINVPAFQNLFFSPVNIFVRDIMFPVCVSIVDEDFLLLLLLPVDVLLS